MPNKSAELINEIASYYQSISVANGYYNDVQTIGFGEESYNEAARDISNFPMVKIIVNDLVIPTFSTKSCSRTQLDFIVHGYLNKGQNRESGQNTYDDSLNWAKDLRDAFREYLNLQSVVDADLLDDQFAQKIGFSNNIITVSSIFTLSFDEKLGV